MQFIFIKKHEFILCSRHAKSGLAIQILVFLTMANPDFACLQPRDLPEGYKRKKFFSRSFDKNFKTEIFLKIEHFSQEIFFLLYPSGRSLGCRHAKSRLAIVKKKKFVWLILTLHVETRVQMCYCIFVAHIL